MPPSKKAGPTPHFPIHSPDIMPIAINYPADDTPGPTPATRAYLVLGVNYSLFLLAFLFVSARILVKAKLRKLGREDVLIVFSTVCNNPTLA